MSEARIEPGCLFGGVSGPPSEGRARSIVISTPTLLTLAHLLGLVLAVGAATVKLTLLFRCKTDPSFVPEYLRLSKPVTRQIITGLVLLTLSGIGWLIYGYPFSTALIVKLILVLAVWILGPVIDNVVEPNFAKLVPGSGEPPSSEFLEAQRRYLFMELLATGLFYAIIVMWVLV